MQHRSPRALSLVLAAVLLVVRAASLGAQAVPPSEPLFRLSTPGFDIFFPGSMEHQARRLAGFADSERAAIEALLAIPPDGRRIPVLLGDSLPWLSGSTSYAPSERIVLNIAPAEYYGELSGMRDELREAFAHELTHALSLGLRSPFWALGARIFGDTVAPEFWMIPRSISEGTAIYAESRSGSGRLNDPAALAPVLTDASEAVRRDFWEVSGSGSRPDSGSLAYLYGAMFTDYVAERFGREAVGALWREGSGGDIFLGFDGAFAPGGIFGKVTGVSLEEAWRDFLDRLGDGRAKGGGEGSASRVSGGREYSIAMDARGSVLYWVDAERGAAFRSDFAGGGRRPAEAEYLFAADWAVGDIRVSADGGSLEVEWARQGPGGTFQPTIGTFSLDTRRFTGTAPRTAPPIGRLRRVEGWPYAYGLARTDRGMAAARVHAASGKPAVSGNLESAPEMPEILSGGGLGRVISVFPWRDRDGVTLAILHTGMRGVPVVSLFRDGASEAASLGDLPGTSGAILDAVILDGGTLAFLRRAESGAMEVMSVGIPPRGHGENTGVAASWTAPGRKDPGSEAGPAATGVAAPAFLPLLGRTLRAPWIENGTFGIDLKGADIARVVAWEARAGWDSILSGPEAVLGATVDSGRLALSLSVSDTLESPGGTTRTRATKGGASLAWTWLGNPLHERLTAGIDLRGAFKGAAEAVGTMWTPARDRSQVAGAGWTAWSNLRGSYFAPFDLKGLSFLLGAEIEDASISVSWSALFATDFLGLTLRVAGAWSASPALRFKPAFRQVGTGGSAVLSLLPTAWPSMGEYASCPDSGSWLAFGELSFRLYAPQASPHPPRPGSARIPLRARGFSARAGGRIALFDPGSGIALPSSLFLRSEMDFSPLLGSLAESGIMAIAELDWTPDTARSGGTPFTLSYGISMGAP